jgi:hypothetical protein
MEFASGPDVLHVSANFHLKARNDTVDWMCRKALAHAERHSFRA